MPIVKIRGLSSVGVIKDLPPSDLPLNAFTDARNVRFATGRIENMGGYAPVFLDGKPSREVPLCVATIPNTNEKIYATEKNLYRIVGVNYRNANYNDKLYNASPENRWQTTTLSNVLVINNPKDNPQGYSPNTQTFIEIPGWGVPNYGDDTKVDWKCGSMRSYKNYLLAINMIEGGIEKKQRIRWSDVADVNALPPNWHQNNEATDGGFNDLSDCSGQLFDGLQLRDYFILYSDKETYVMSYEGGDLVFGFQKLFSDSGILTKGCVAEFEGKHYVVTKEDIIVHDGSQRQSIVEGKVKKFLAEEIASINPDATRVFINKETKELWVLYVGVGAETGAGVFDYAANKAAIYNIASGTWSFYDMPPTYGIELMQEPSEGESEWETYAEDWGAIGNAEKEWRASNTSFYNNRIYSASKDGCMYLLDYGSFNLRWREMPRIVENLGETSSTLERSGMDFDQQLDLAKRYKLIKAIYPYISGNGVLKFHIGSHRLLNETPDYYEAYDYDLRNDYKVDCFVSGRYLAYRLHNTTLSNWKLDSLDFDVVAEGMR